MVVVRTYTEIGIESMWRHISRKKKNAEDREHEHFILSKSFDVHSLLFYGSAGVDRRRHTRSGACFEYP